MRPNLTREQVNALTRIQDRSWVAVIFTITRLWFIAIGPVIKKILDKYNLECNIPLWKHTVNLSIGEEFKIEVFVKGDDEKNCKFRLRIWRTRFFVKAQPVWD